MSNGSDIAAEIAQGLADAGIDTGAGALVAKIVRDPSDAPTTPWGSASPSPDLNYDLNCIRDKWTQEELSNSSIQSTDLKVIAQAGVIVPTVQDKLELQDETYQIMNVTPEAPGGVDLYYVIQARK